RGGVVWEARGSFRQKRASRHGRRVACRIPASDLGGSRRVSRGGKPIWNSERRGLQHRRQQRHLLFPYESETRSTLVIGAWLSEAGISSGQPSPPNPLPP